MRPACPPPPTVAVAVSVAAWLGALCCCAGPAAAELGVEARLAWEGYARPEQWTELTLRIASDRGGPVELEIGGAWPVRSEIQIEAGRTRTVRLPAQPGLDGDAISVQVNGPGGSASTRVSPRFPPAGRRTVAFVAAEP
ncbi:MAG: hypothetical protein O7A09_05385, partial [Proteobacteria bacterium]|nr:hypothetical protein [Pseudomonadota bacterium]